MIITTNECSYCCYAHVRTNWTDETETFRSVPLVVIILNYQLIYIAPFGKNFWKYNYKNGFVSLTGSFVFPKMQTKHLKRMQEIARVNLKMHGYWDLVIANRHWWIILKHIWCSIIRNHEQNNYFVVAQLFINMKYNA